MKAILSRETTLVKLLATAGLAATLAACGGGPSPSESTQKITVSGTAATGLAIANATIGMTCKGGSTTGTTGADGTFALTVNNTAAGPCVLSVTTPGGTLRSIANGDGTRANVTPLTELLVTYISVQSGLGASASPTALVGSPAVSTVVNTPSVMAASVKQVIGQISSLAPGVTVPTDFLTAPLQAKTATNPTNNAQDQVLDALRLGGVITANGTPSPAVVTKTTTDASQHTVTGGTGAS